MLMMTEDDRMRRREKGTSSELLQGRYIASRVETVPVIPVLPSVRERETAITNASQQSQAGSHRHTSHRGHIAHRTERCCIHRQRPRAVDSSFLFRSSGAATIVARRLGLFCLSPPGCCCCRRCSQLIRPVHCPALCFKSCLS